MARKEQMPSDPVEPSVRDVARMEQI
jgi:hypothetical protein